MLYNRPVHLLMATKLLHFFAELHPISWM
uniref:NADH dehydrogenase subunit 4 n=1 Tax=Romanomermis culicivorax TaxID=13658 RepID=A0A915L4K1_ROMCU